MPGRGRPWKEGGLNDNTVTGADIKTGTIEFSDLNTSLQTQITEGGGGGIDLFLQTELLDDFYYQFPDVAWLSTVKYTVQEGPDAIATLQPISGSNFAGGLVLFSVEAVNIGDGAGFKSGNTFDGANLFDLSKNITMRVRASLTSTLADRNDAIGIVDDNFSLQGVTTLATMDNSVDEGFYFKSENGGNWIAVSNSQSVGDQEETDTGVPATTNTFQNFEIIHEPLLPKDTFKIDGVTVATHTTYVSTQSVTAYLTNWVITNLATGSRGHEIDLWHVVADR